MSGGKVISDGVHTSLAVPLEGWEAGSGRSGCMLGCPPIDLDLSMVLGQGMSSQMIQMVVLKVAELQLQILLPSPAPRC
jgi:hypothetical protein